MATGIGNLSLKLSLDPSQMTAGLATATKAIENFGSKAPALAGGFAYAVRSGFTVANAAVGKFNDMLDKPLMYMSNLTKQIPYLGQTLALPLDAAQGMLDTYTEGAKRIEEVGKAAAKSGTDIGTFQTLMVASKMDADVLAKSLNRLKSNLAQAAQGNEEMKRKYEQYGLDPAQLFKLNEADQFAAIFDKVKAIGNEAMRARLLADVIDKKAGMNLLPVAVKGGDFIRKKADLIDSLGLRMTDQDFKNIKDAGEFAKTISLFREAVTHQVTSGLAPFLAEFNALFDGMKLSAKGLSEYVHYFASGFVYAGSLAASAWSWLMGMMPSLGGFFQEAGAWALNFVGFLIEKLTSLVDLVGQLVGLLKQIPTASPGQLGGWGAWAASQAAWLQSRFQIPFNPMPGGEGGGGVPQAAAEVADKMTEAGNRVWAAVVKLGAALGLDGLGGILADATQTYDGFMKAVNARKAATAKMANELNRDDIMALYGERLERLSDSLRTPFEKLFKDLREFEEMAAAARRFGLIDDATINRFAYKQFEALKSSVRMPELKAPAALLEGSREAYSLILAAQRDGRKTPEEEMVELLKEANRQGQRQEELGKKFIKVLENFGGQEID